jgi:hypothetical protein
LVFGRALTVCDKYNFVHYFDFSTGTLFSSTVSVKGMRYSLPFRILIAYLAVFSAISAYACQCGIGGRGRNAWENAQEFASSSDIIFEGEPIKFELRWGLLTAKEGDLVPIDVFSYKQPTEPRMVITFRVSHIYKGHLGREVQLHTGLGGGDCAALYDPGLSYLVYAYGPNMELLSVSMCSPGGWIESEIGDRNVATDLRYLRKKRPTAKDLAPIRGRWSQKDYAKEEPTRKKNYEEWRQKYDAATGQICGTVVHDDPSDKGEGSIAFLSTLGYSPNSFDYAERQDDGSFCSRNLGPGKYYLYFVQRNDHDAAALYYPGVTDVARATPIEVHAGQKQANIVFHVTKQPSYSVRGFVSADDRSIFDSEPVGAAISLVRSDGDRRVWYSAKTTFRLLPRLVYFKVDDVPPGRYFAFAQGGTGWMIRKVLVDVTTRSKFISVNLVHTK